MSPEVQTNATAFVGGLIYLAAYTLARLAWRRRRAGKKISIR
ncbi:hypothetical protein [Methylobacterium sp. WL103]|nr:hypothetical protein [Methylobacterium sp. WL103]